MLDAIDARLVSTLGQDALDKLHHSSVALLGLGMLGGSVASHLAMLQVRQLVVDSGRVELPNCGNQALPVESIGQWKAEARADQIRALNPSCPVRAIHARVEDLGLGVFRGIDLLVTGLDNRASRVRVREISQGLGIPWVDAALDGSGQSLFGTVTFYDPRRSDSACYGCRYDQEALGRIGREGRGRGCPSWRALDIPVYPPTLAASPFGAIIGGFQTLWAIRALTGEEDRLVNRQLQIRADESPQVRVLKLTRSAHCAFDHFGFETLLSPSCATLGDMIEHAASDLGGAPDALLFHGRSLAFGLRCLDCDRTRDLVRVREAYTDEDLRCVCGSRSEMLPVHLSDRIEGSDLERLAHLAWAELGVPRCDVVTVTRGTGGRVHYVVHPEPTTASIPTLEATSAVERKST